MNPFSADSLVWPLTLLLVALLIIQRVQQELRPLAASMMAGLARSAQANATQYAIAIMFGLSASLSAMYDVFSQLDSNTLHGMTYHQYASLWAKILNPFIVAVLAYATQNGFVKRDATNTRPPV